MLNSTKLIHEYLSGIAITDPQEKKLLAARKIIRDRLRESFRAAGRSISDSAGRQVSVTPKFLTQGSMAYRTINQPAFPPQQQLDLDDGAYLPMTFLEGLGPQVASDLFFRFVDQVMEELAAEKRWQFDGTKDTCVRVILDDESHVDVPLYAIPYEDFHLLEAKMEAKGMASMSAFSKADDLYVDPTRVQLAHREKGWTPSDPREIQVWFFRAIDEYGPQLRRMCRLLKGWRDVHPDLDGLTSILIMAAVYQVYRDFSTLSKQDDLALLVISGELPGVFEGKVRNPANLDEVLSDRVPPAVMDRASDLVWGFHKELDSSLNRNYVAENVVKCLRRHLGDRVPYRPDLVSVEKPKATVTRIPAETVPAAMVVSSKAG